LGLRSLSLPLYSYQKMEDKMKPLIAITCVAILVALGYFGWGEYSAAQQRERVAELRSEREFCLTWLKNDGRSQAKRAVTEDCIKRGMLTLEDIQSVSPPSPFVH
jgi:hypothetical protein